MHIIRIYTLAIFDDTYLFCICYLGYLAASLCFGDNHELTLLLFNTIQRDLSSTNILQVCMALTACTYFVSNEMTPLILPMIEEKVKHDE